MALQNPGRGFTTRLKNFLLDDVAVFFIASGVPAALLAAYSLTSSFVLPNGVNAAFSKWVWKIFAYYLTVPLIFILVRLFLKKDLTFLNRGKPESFTAGDFVFILIPMTPVVQYILSNQDSISILSALLIFIFFAIITTVFGVVVPVLLSKFAPKKVLLTASISFICLTLSMASISTAFGWSQKGSKLILSLVLIAVIVVLSMRVFIPEKIFNLAIIIFFSVNTVTGLANKKQPAEHHKEKISADMKNLSVVSVLDGMKIKRHNDILLIFYEAYADNETIQHYGSDNSDQLKFLEENGFTIYHGIYSLGTPTQVSFVRTFNLDADLMEHRKYLAGAGAVHSLLHQQGYKTYGVFDNNWNLRGLQISEIKYDLCYPQPSGAMDTRILINAILTGEFTDTVSFAGINFETYLQHKQKVINKEFATPAFMYSHSNNPGHGPSGSGIEPEKRDKYVQEYLKYLARANIEMKSDVKAVIQNNPDALVVIAGDHGPFLTKTGYGLGKGRGNFTINDIDRYDVQDRFGTFLAIRWPEKKYARRYDIKILQDIFPAIFSYLFNDDTLFNRIKMKRITQNRNEVLGVYIKDGIIYGGRDNGQPLFIMQK